MDQQPVLQDLDEEKKSSEFSAEFQGPEDQ
jgi:hypothetical protein